MTDYLPFYILIGVFILIFGYVVAAMSLLARRLKKFAAQHAYRYQQKDDGTIEKRVNEVIATDTQRGTRSIYAIRDIVTYGDIYLFRCADRSGDDTTQRLAVFYALPVAADVEYFNMPILPDLATRFNSRYKDNPVFVKLDAAVKSHPTRKGIAVAIKDKQALMYQVIARGMDGQKDFEYLFTLARAIQEALR